MFLCFLDFFFFFFFFELRPKGYSLSLLNLKVKGSSKSGRAKTGGLK